MNKNQVQIWEEIVTIPTYRIFPSEKIPLFIENRAYQGSTGKVYPLPVTEKISDQKEDVSYKAVYLENDYLLVMILPELGGRIQRALDKTNNYDFVYYNHVIKPALVGLTGPWISGGIEFNWPQHHRPSTCSPVDYRLKKGRDGSATVYLSEIDKMYGTKGMGAITLYPGKAYIEIRGQLFNCTDLPQTFLWWANPAVPVNEHTYSVFPPDVQAVMDHGKRAVSTFPIATGEYYKYDYSEGIDISCYRNIKVPTSYMAAHSDYDFIGNFDEEKDAGLLHVANHHISPGKKQWTWGNGDFGKAWDRNLTDADGPYIELMTGVYTDNQPDFTWLAPYEEKTFTQYFMPYKHVGRVKNATRDAAVGIELLDGRCRIRAYTSGSFPNTTVTVEKKGQLLFSEKVSFEACVPFEASFDTELTEPEGLRITLRTENGKNLVSYTWLPRKNEPVPSPAEAIPAPEKLKTTEELYLAATHLEQYRHATLNPEDYYLEGLRRDSTDLRLNNGYGLYQLRQGKFAEAAACFKKAVKKQTWKNPNPQSGDCYFNLGLALEFAGSPEAAFDAFYKSTWSSDTRSAGYYWLALLSCRQGDYENSLSFAGKSLTGGWHNMKVRVLMASLSRLLNQDASAFLTESAAIDPLCMGILYEQGLLKGDLSGWEEKMRLPAHNYLELALDYIRAGLYRDAFAILSSCKDTSPMISYYKGYVLEQTGETKDAQRAYREGERRSSARCFPNRLQEISILESAIHALVSAPHAHYYLGCLFYDKKRYDEAFAHWKKTMEELPDFAVNLRNLAIYCYNRKKDAGNALRLMEKAFRLDPGNSRFLLEYDQLRAKAGVSKEDRLMLLEQNLETVVSRDALYMEYISLLNACGKYEKALQCLKEHRFHPWEGGEGRASTQYRYALTQLAIRAIEKSEYDHAAGLLEATKTWPENLGEGRLPNVQDTIADYYLGLIRERQSKPAEAEYFYTKASTGLSEPSSMLYYNDQPSDTIFYQGLACEKLGHPGEARKWYHKLLSYGQKHIFDVVTYDYFAVSLPEMDLFPEDIQRRNDIYCRYLMALGYIGLKKYKEADKLLQQILDVKPDHQGALQHLDFLLRR